MEIVNELNVRKTFVYDMLKLQTATGLVKPKEAAGGRPLAIDETELLEIEALIYETPDITLEEIKENLSLDASISTICNAINNKLDLRYKKTLFDNGQNREDVQEARECWKNDQPEMDPAKLVFLDEAGINTGMTRLYGRAPGGERVVEYIPDVRFERTSILSSVRLNGAMVPLVFEGALNGDIFLGYIQKFLVPTLQKDDIVIMDSLSSHKVKGVADAIEAKGAFVLYLPGYSPDLNPIEQMWSKVKAYLRKVKARTIAALYEAIKDALDLISLSDIKGWFSDANYSVVF